MRGLLERTELKNKKTWVFRGVIRGLLERTELKIKKMSLFRGHQRIA